jgi:hypothetical protein
MSARILTLSHQINNDSIPLLEALQSARHLGIAAIEATNTFALISALGPMRQQRRPPTAPIGRPNW